MVEEVDVGMCPVCIGFRYGKDIQMITGMLILVLDDKEEKLKSKEESIFTTNYYT